MIKASNLSYCYRGNATDSVRGISFSVNRGEIFGFLGPSGAGKSTTQKLLIKLLGGFRGEVQILGKALSDWGNSYYERIGVGFELPNHYLKLTALENLRFFATFYPSVRINFMEVLNMVGLANDAGKRVEGFSKGMKMRLNFARAIMHKPELLFLDEPTSGLDPGYSRMLKNIIVDLKRNGTTIFLTTHNMHDADELCDRVAFMVDGELKLTGIPHELKLMNGKRQVRVEVVRDGKITFLHFDMENLGANPDFQRSLTENNIRSIHSCEDSLEDVFLRTTGKRLESNNDANR